jgi:hypothetical protein
MEKCTCPKPDEPAQLASPATPGSGYRFGIRPTGGTHQSEEGRHLLLPPLGRQSDGELHVPTVFEDHRSTSLTATSSPLSFRAYWQVSEVIHARNPNWNRRRIPAVAVAVAAMSTSLSSFKTPQSTTREPWCFSTLSVSQHISSSRNHRGRRRMFPGEPPLEATPEAVKRSRRSA